jgi:uncharacterized membrane protein YhaH (DUF805 family)
MIEVVKRVYNNYAIFSGRESRSDFWIFQFFLVLLYAAIALLNLALISAGASSSSWFILSAILTGINVLVGLFSLLTIIPAMALHSRRLHDANFSAWWLFLALIPGIGVFAVYAMATIPGTSGVSKFENEGGSSSGVNQFQQPVASSASGADLW